MEEKKLLFRYICSNKKSIDTNREMFVTLKKYMVYQNIGLPLIKLRYSEVVLYTQKCELHKNITFRMVLIRSYV